jgi:hypothetical protein
MNKYAVEDPIAFGERVSIVKAKGQIFQLEVNTWLPKHNSNNQLSFFDLQNLFNLHKPPPLPALPRLAGEGMIQHWSREAKADEQMRAPYGPDFLFVSLDGTATVINPDGTQSQQEGVFVGIPCTVFSVSDFVFADVRGMYFAITDVGEAQRQGINLRNEIHGLTVSPELELWAQAWTRQHPAELQATPQTTSRLKELPSSLRASNYFIHTGQEIDALERSACDGLRGTHWRTEAQQGTRVYERRGASHLVKLKQQRDSGEELSLNALEALTLSQDADFSYTLLYITRVLAPPSPLPAHQAAVGWIDLDDVMQVIGWYPSKFSAAERDQMRGRLWSYIAYGDRAIVTGARTNTYMDRATREEIPTRIESPIWRVMSVENPVQRVSTGEVPRRVQLVISKEWEPLLTDERLTQYLPLGEVLGSIPSRRVAGDWARCMGLVLARLWRMSPRETMHTIELPNAQDKSKLESVWMCQIEPTRRELLTTYTPKTKTAEELLSSSNPQRAVKYWHDALALLHTYGFIANIGEPNRTVAQMLSPFKGQYNWGENWLNEKVKIVPGSSIRPAVQERADALPPAKPKDLQSAYKRSKQRKKQV